MSPNDGATMLKVFLGVMLAGPLFGCQSPEPSSVSVTSHPVKTGGTPREAGAAEAVLAADDAPSAADMALTIGDTLRVGAWNLRWLGLPQMRGASPSNLDDLAAYIDAADVVVLGVSEVAWHDTINDFKANWQLNRLMPLLNQRTGGDWEYQLFEQRTNGTQLCGVLWDRNVVELTDLRRIEVPRKVSGTYIWNRVPYAAKFATGPNATDFVVIPIHMKANTRSNNSGNLTKRKLEAEQLVAKLAAVMADLDDEDFIIIGDSNMLTQNETAARRIFEWERPAGQAFFVQLGGDVGTFVGSDVPFDRAFVPAAQPEFAARAFEVLDADFLSAQRLSAVDFKERCSDHWMIVTTLQVQADDDP